MREKKPKDYLTTGEAADHLGLGESTLVKMRGQPGGPPFIQMGTRLIRYQPAVLDDWAASRRRRGTWEYARRPELPGERQP